MTTHQPFYDLAEACRGAITKLQHSGAPPERIADKIRSYFVVAAAEAQSDTARAIRSLLDVELATLGLTSDQHTRVSALALRIDEEFVFAMPREDARA